MTPRILRRARRPRPGAWVVALVALLSSWSAAQPPTAIVSAVHEQTCAATRFGGDLNCSASEFSVDLAFTQPSATRIDSCTAGETILVDVLTSINAPNTDRYDVALFFGEQGNDPQIDDPNQTCSVATFPLAPDPPFFNLTPTTNNVCGEYRNGETSTLQVENVALQCVAQPGSGEVTVPALLSYDNNQNNAVNNLDCDETNVVPNTKSKCSATALSGTLDVFVNAWVRVTKATVPAGSGEAFDFTATASGTTLPASPAAFSLADGESQLVEVRLAANGTRTVVIEEAALDGWGPDATIACTSPTGGSAASYVTIDAADRRITADLSSTDFGAECTVTNTRQTRVRTSKALEPVTDPGRFDLSVAGFTATEQGDGGTTGYRVVPEGSSVAFGETASAGTDLADYVTSYVCVDDVTGDMRASGEGSSITLTAPDFTDTTCTFTNVLDSADLELVKTADLNGPEPSDVLTYSLVVTNNGPLAATGVHVTDPLPSGVTFVSASAECVDLAGVVTCDIAELLAGASASLEVVVEVDDGLPLGTALVNDASVSSDQRDFVPGNEDASVALTVSGLALEKSVCNLSASACADPADFAGSVAGVPGDVLEYRVRFERFGPPAFDLELADDVPPEAALVVDAFGAGQDVRVTCPDGSDAFVATGLVATIVFDLADVCALDTATRTDGTTVSEALLSGQAGEFRFRIGIP